MGAIVTAFCTDNEAKMVKMRELLKQTHSHIQTYGCSSHYLNLLGADITVTSVVNQVNTINKYFRNHHIPNALLNEHAEAVKPVIPGATRWNSQIDCLRSYVTNRPFMMLICNNDDNDIDGNTTKLVNDMNLYKNVKHHIEQLQLISVALDKSQSDNCSIADICDIWLSLLEQSELALHKSKILKRIKQALTSSHYLAYMMHPCYLGMRLDEDQRQLGRDLLSIINPNLTPVLSQLKARVHPFQEFMFSSSYLKQHPTNWYACVKAETGIDDLSEFCDTALRFLKMPASAACIERVFSNYSLVQNKIRNRLGGERAAKLVACYRALRGVEPVDW
jgi:hypothetical protein